MKKATTLATLALCFSLQIAVAQCPGTWQPVPSGLSTELRALHFPTAKDGWAVGAAGKIIRSADGGLTWGTAQSSGTAATLNGVHFVSASTGWSVGHRGIILKTSNSGGTWTPQTSNTETDLFDVWFTDAQNGWVVGACGLILRTTDGGQQWAQVSSGKDYNIRQVKVLPNGKGFTTTTGTALIATANSGANWNSQTTAPRNFRGMDLDASGLAFAASKDGQLLKSSDYGSTWANAAAPAGSGNWEALSMTSATHITLAGLNGQVFRSTDGGTSWASLRTGLDSTDIFGLQMSGDTLGWAVGAEGKVFRYMCAVTLLPDMIPVPGGTFNMGCFKPNTLCDPKENPVHPVTLPNFQIGKYEVTQAEWEAVMGDISPDSIPFAKTCGGNCPMEKMTWYGAVVYCNRLSEQNGLAPCYYADTAFTQVFGKNGNIWSLPNSGTVHWKKDADGYRLPTEAEWEYAARGGAQSQGFRYAGGNGPNAVAWHKAISGGKPHPVGTRDPNELGLYDMSGNVWELCWDWYSTYNSAAACSPIGPDTGTKRMSRGGSFDNAEDLARVSYRPFFPEPNNGVFDIGFRLAQGKVLPNCTNTLVQPAHAATNVLTNTVLRWATSKPCASGYRLSLGTTPGGSQILNNATVTDTFYQAALPAGATIYARIVPFNGAGEASGCGEFSFGTAPKTLECTTPPNTKATAFQYVYGDTDAQSVPVDGATQTCDGGYAAVGYTNDKKLYFFKTDANGQVEFSKYYENPDFDLRGSGVLYKEGDGYLLYGAGISVALLNRIFVIKTDLSGNPQWSKSYELRYSDIRLDTSWQVNDLVEIVVTTDSNYVLATNSAKKCVIKLDRQGNVLSDVAIIDFIPPDKTSKFFDYATDMAPTADGGVVLTGFSFTSGVPLIKLDKNLNIQFAKNFDDTAPYSNCEDVGGQVLQTSDGGYLITGGTKTHGNGVCTPNYGGYTDAFVLKTDAAGNYIWSKTYGTAGNGNFGIGLHPLDAENYLLSIHSNATGQGGSIVYGSIKQSDGTINWARNIDGTCSEYGGVQPLPLGGYLLNGSTSSAGNGGNDHLLIKMDTSLMATGCFSSTPITLQAVAYTPAKSTNILEAAINMTAFPINLAITVSDARFSAKSTCTCSTLVTNTSDDDCTGSLRSAIRCANRNPGADTIRFAIPGAGPHVINLMTELPRLTDSATVLDATTQPGWKLGKIVLEWKGGANGNPCIMFIEGNKCEIYGLHFRNIYGSNDFGAQILGSNNIFGGNRKPNLFNDANIAINVGGTNNTIQYNYFGTDTTGAVLGNKQPLGINGNYIGIGTTVNNSNISIHHNIFSGYQFGIVGNSSGAIRNNYFGTDTSNTAALNLEMGLAVQNNGSYEINQNIFANCSSWAINFNSNATIGQNKVIENIIRDNGSAIGLGTSNGNLFSQNSIYCNGVGIAILAGANNNQPAPQILTPLSDRLAGTATAGATVELFLHDTTGCPSVPCQGKTYLGTAIADASGKWMLSAPFPLSLKAGDLVTATATDSLDNTSAFAACAAIIVCNLTASAPPDTTLCPSSPITLTASGGSTYQWSDGGPATPQWTFTPTATKTYTVTATDVNGCTAVDSVKVTVQSGLDCGLVAHYKLDGNGLDASGNGNTSTNIGGVAGVQDRFGNCNRSMRFNGASYLSAPSSPSLNTPTKGITMSCWAKAKDTSGNLSSLICKVGPGDFDLHYRMGVDANNNLYMGLTRSGQTVYEDKRLLLPADYKREVWHLYTAAWDSDSARLFLDGKQLSIPFYFPGQITTLNATLNLGRDQHGPDEIVIADLDDLRIYNRALTPAEITALYTLPNDNPNPAPAAALSTPKTAICTGESTTLTAAPTQAGYTYAWLRDGQVITGASASTYTATQAGAYQVRVSAGQNCDSLSAAVQIMVTALDVSALGDTLTCASPVVVLQGNSSVPGVTYGWTGPNNFATVQQNPPVSVAGTYILSVSDPVSGCTARDTVVVEAAIGVPSATIGTPNGTLLSCTVDSLRLIAPAGAGYTYAWSNGAKTAQIITKTPGTYTLTVTNTQNGCTAASFVVIEKNTQKPDANALGGELPCKNPFVVLQGQSNTAGVSYAWAGPNGFTTNQPNPPVSVAGSYTLTVRNPQNGCTSTVVTTVTPQVFPTASVGKPNGLVLNCDLVTLSLQASGGDQYNWAGPGGFTAAQAEISVNTAGIYTVTVTTSANGCSSTMTTSISQDIAKPNISAVGGLITCAQPSVVIKGNSNTPNVGYTWAGPNNFASTQQNPSVAVAGTYILTLRNPQNGCTSTISAIVIADKQHPDSSITASNGLEISCKRPVLPLEGKLANGLTYKWAGPNNFSANTLQANIALAGTYTITVTNPQNGCSSTNTVSVTANTQKPDVSAIGGILNCGAGATVTLQGQSNTTNASYSWSGPGNFTSPLQNPSVNVAGTYTLTVTNPQNGCTQSMAASVVPASKPPAAISAQNGLQLNCKFNTLPLLASGGDAYIWSGGLGSNAGANISNPGIYTVTVTNNLTQCSATATVSISRNISPPTALATANGTLTCIQKNIALLGNSNTTGATYAWAGPNNFASAQQNPVVGTAGVYTLTVTGPNFCTATATAEIKGSPSLPQIGATAGTITCKQPNAELTGTSDIAGSQFLWEAPGGTAFYSGAKVSVNLPGVYTLTVTSSPGCTASTSIVVADGTAKPVVNAAGGALGCISKTLQLQGGSAVPGATFAWSGPNNFSNSTANPVVLLAGNYTLTVTDPANGCTNSKTVTVTPEKQAQPVISGLFSFCEGSSTTLFGSAGFEQYEWSNGLMTDKIEVATAGIYTLKVTDAAGCTGTQSVTAVRNPAPKALLLLSENSGTPGDNVVCAGSEIGLSAGGGSSYLFTQNGMPIGGFQAQNVQIVKMTQGVVFGVQVRDANGCTDSTTLAEPPGNKSIAVSVLVSPNLEAATLSAINECPGKPTRVLLNLPNCPDATYNVTYQLNGQNTLTAAVSVSNHHGELDLGVLSPGSVVCNVLSIRTVGTDCAANFPTGKAINVSILPVPSSTLDTTVCYTQPFMVNGITYPAGKHKIVLMRNGCDSVLNLNLSVVTTFKKTITASFCQDSYYLFEGDTLRTGGTYTKLKNGPFDCKTELTLTLTQTSPVSKKIIKDICPGDSFAVGDSVFTQQGVYEIKLKSKSGCDSIVQLQLGVHPLDVKFTPSVIDACEGVNIKIAPVIKGCPSCKYKWDGGGVTESIFVTPKGEKIYTVTVTDNKNCKLSASVQVNAQPAYDLEQEALLCPGDTIRAGALRITKPGQYLLELKSRFGCDSTVTLTVKAFDAQLIVARRDTLLLAPRSASGEAELTKNDQKPNVFALKLVETQGPQHGKADLRGKDKVLYTLNSTDFSGLDSFRYVLCPELGCPEACDTAWVLVQVQAGSLEEAMKTMPNFITPEMEDGLNDLFEPVRHLVLRGIIVRSSELLILNRWGEVVHRSEDGRWDGRINGQMAPPATYYYRLILQTGEQRVVKGAIGVIR